MRNLIRYTVRVVENGDTYHAFNKDAINTWIAHYRYGVSNQDNSWTPHFEVSMEIAIA